jgi:Lamin Tail Domain
MDYLSRPLVLLLLCGLLVSSLWLVPHVRAEVLINEVLGDPDQDWDGDGEVNYKSDEWIEVKNDGDSVEDLSEYWVRDGSGEDPHLQLSGALEPGETAVFYGSDAMIWQQEQGQSTLGFSINNSGETLELLRTESDFSGTALIVVHQVILLDHEVENDRSSGWDPDTGQWIMFDALNPYNGAFEPQGNNCLPSPGELNICTPLVPVFGLTWDQLKSRYR